MAMSHDCRRCCLSRRDCVKYLSLSALGAGTELPKVLAGQCNAQATYYVDAGGAKDQGVFLSQNLEFPVVLPPGGAKELTFYLACPQGAAPADSAVWAPAALFRAAQAVWHDWPKK